MTTSIAMIAQTMAVTFLSASACATYEPMPGNVQVVLPTVTASEATSMNQPPDIDISMFQIRPGIANGTSSRQKRCQEVSRNPFDASLKSAGTVRSDWNMLKAMFHAWLVKMTKMQQNSAPSTLPGASDRKNVVVNVRNDRIGTDCRMSRIGTSTRPARLLLAAHGA